MHPRRTRPSLVGARQAALCGPRAKIAVDAVDIEAKERHPIAQPPLGQHALRLRRELRTPPTIPGQGRSPHAQPLKGLKPQIVRQPSAHGPYTIGLAQHGVGIFHQLECMRQENRVDGIRAEGQRIERRAQRDPRDSSPAPPESCAGCVLPSSKCRAGPHAPTQQKFETEYRHPAPGSLSAASSRSTRARSRASSNQSARRISRDMIPTFRAPHAENTSEVRMLRVKYAAKCLFMPSI